MSIFLKIRYFAGQANSNTPFVVFRENITDLFSAMGEAGEKHLVVL